jgi:hypothetical protein
LWLASEGDEASREGAVAMTWSPRDNTVLITSLLVGLVGAGLCAEGACASWSGLVPEPTPRPPPLPAKTTEAGTTAYGPAVPTAGGLMPDKAAEPCGKEPAIREAAGVACEAASGAGAGGGC